MGIERPEDEPSGLPDDGPEAPPLGVPEGERDKEEHEDDVSLPGIPSEDDPPMTG